jgi:hypothetical protein
MGEMTHRTSHVDLVKNGLGRPEMGLPLPLEADLPIETPTTLVIPIMGVIEVTRITGVARGLGWLGLDRGRCGVVTDPWLQYLTVGNHLTNQNPYVCCLHPG